MAVGAVTIQPLPVTDVVIGRSQLSGGTVSVTLKSINDNSLVFCQGNDANVTGVLKVAITSGTGFSITSTVGGDTGFVAWMVVIRPPA